VPDAAPAAPADPAAPAAQAAPADELLRALVEVGPREAGAPALARARAWANARLAESGYAPAGAPAAFLLAAPLDTRPADAAGLAEQSAGAAAVLEAACALAADEPRVSFEVALLEGAPGSPEWRAALGAPARVAAAELVVFVARACGLPGRRDLLSHRVLRERFFEAAGTAPPFGVFELARAPHTELAAAGARRIVAIDAPASGGACSPAAAGDALAKFIRDASALLAQSRPQADFGEPSEPESNPAAPPAS
jgi:hypothetical protein